MAISWQTEVKKLSELKDYDKNPRKIGKKEFSDLVRSIKEDGYHQRLLVNRDGTIIGGHQRKKAMLKAGFKEDTEIEVLMPSATLHQEVFDRINIRDNLSFGEYDFDILAANFEAETLIDWGMPKSKLNLNDENDVKHLDSHISQSTPKEKCKSCGQTIKE